MQKKTEKIYLKYKNIKLNLEMNFPTLFYSFNVGKNTYAL